MVTGPETARLPVCSAIVKQRTGEVVFKWETTSVNPLLCFLACSSYIFALVST
jgi:hypothetical protein